MNLEREPRDLFKHALTRRQLLHRGATGIGSLALGSLLAPEAFASGLARDGARQFAPRAKRIIFLLSLIHI